MISSSGAVGDYFTILKGASQSAPPAAPANFTATPNGASANLLGPTTRPTRPATLERSSTARPSRSPHRRQPDHLHEHRPELRQRLLLSPPLLEQRRLFGLLGYRQPCPSGALAIDRQPQSLTTDAGPRPFLRAGPRHGADHLPMVSRTHAADRPDQQHAQAAELQAATRAYSVVLSDGGAPLPSEAAILTVRSTVMPPIIVVPPQVVGGMFTVGLEVPFTPFSV